MMGKNCTKDSGIRTGGNARQRRKVKRWMDRFTKEIIEEIKKEEVLKGIKPYSLWTKWRQFYEQAV